MALTILRPSMPKVKVSSPTNKFNGLINYLLTTYPTKQANIMLFYMKNKDMYSSPMSIGYTYTAGLCTARKFCPEIGGYEFNIKVALGAPDDPRTDAEVAHIIAHEYRHALQKDFEVPAPDTELDADLFALKAVEEYTGDTSIETRNKKKLYPSTQRHLAAQANQ